MENTDYALFFGCFSTEKLENEHRIEYDIG